MVTFGINSTCNTLVDNIRASGLNLSCQETQYSLYITIRKSFTRYRKDQLASKTMKHSLDDFAKDEQDQLHEASQKHKNLKVKYDHLLVEKKNLEVTLNTAKQELQSALRECEMMEEVIE